MSEKATKGKFQINVGAVDSFIRIFVGLGLLCGSLMGVVGRWGLPVGAVIVITGLSRYCVAYNLFKLNTNRCDSPEAQ